MNDSELQKIWNCEILCSQKSHGKAFTSSVDEDARKKNFRKNIQQIIAHNQEYEAGKQIFKLGVNKYSDMSFEEFSKAKLGYKPSVKNQ